MPIVTATAFAISGITGGAEAKTTSLHRWTTTTVAPVAAAAAPAPTSTTLPVPGGFSSVAGPTPTWGGGARPAVAALKTAATKPGRTTTPASPGAPTPTPPAPTPAPAGGIADDFSSQPQGLGWAEGSAHGQWVSVFGGYGQTGIETDGGHGNVLSVSPQASAAPGDTHAALVRSGGTFGDLDATVDVRTVQQLRTGSAPNPWEVGWVLWHYTDNTHFYYFIPKPNGWELGKEDPAYPGAQRFLAAGSSPSYPAGAWNTVRIRQVGTAVTVWVNGDQIVSFTDAERPYANGALGLYSEDAHVHFDNVQLHAP